MSRLFHSLVVCGAGLTLTGCGGRYDGGRPESSDAGNGGGPGGASAGMGLAQPPVLEVGGSQSVGGTSASAGFNFGGTAPGPILPGSEGQWSCDDEIIGCDLGPGRDPSRDGFALGQQCIRDLARPKSQADCQPGSVLSCLLGSFEAIPVWFNCECLPLDAQMCPCPSVAGGGCSFSSGPVTCSPEQVVCGCAWTCITR